MSKIITLDDLKNYMAGTTLDDGVGQTVVDSINAYVETQTGRCFGEAKQVTERYDWQTNIWLRHMDVISIDEITLGWPGQAQSVMPSTGYYLNELGRVTLFSYGSNSGPRTYHDYMAIKYTYGYNKLGFDEDAVTPIVPDDLFSAALGVAAGLYNWASNGQKDVASVQVGSYHIEYTNRRQSAAGQPDPATSTADANWGVIQSYKLRHI